MTGQDGTKSKLPRALVASGFAALIGGAALLYGMAGGGGKVEVSAQCQGAQALSARLAPLAQGEMAAMTLAKAPKPLPELVFEGADGAARSLADFRGRTVLLNIWATWCIPCRQEMPALDDLQRQLGDKDFEVVAINIDTSRLEKRQAFLDSVGVKALAFYADPKADVFQRLKSAGKMSGLPTTMLIDARGCEVGTLQGEAHWASGDAVAMVKAAVGG